MKKIIVASKNPAKINATLAGFEQMFPDQKFSIEGISVSSDVSDQPMTDKETRTGAQNRARNAKLAMPDADFWVGLEGGIETVANKTEAFAWMAIQTKDDQLGEGRTGTFFLPQKIIDLMKTGKELGQATDALFAKTNSKHSSGVVGILTDNAIDRADYYTAAIIFALIPFKNNTLY